MERVPFASLYVFEGAVTVVIHGTQVKIVPYFSSYFEAQNGRGAADQTTTEMETLLKEQCERYFQEYHQKSPPGNIDVYVRFEKEREIIVYDAYLSSSHSASFK